MDTYCIPPCEENTAQDLPVRADTYVSSETTVENLGNSDSMTINDPGMTGWSVYAVSDEVTVQVNGGDVITLAAGETIQSSACEGYLDDEVVITTDAGGEARIIYTVS